MEKLKPIVRNRLTWKIKSFSVDKDSLKNFFQILRQRVLDAGEIEVNNFEQKDQPIDVYEQNKKIIKDGFELNISITSLDGQELFGNIKDVFDFPNFPEQIKSIYMNSEVPLKTIYNYNPRNLFELFLDFSKPELFNLSLMPSQETPNESKIIVQGLDSTWVHGSFNEFTNFIKKYPARLTWLHKHSIYDLLVFGLGLPISFWASYKLSNIIDSIFGKFSTFVQNASYVYVFLASLTIFRLLFHYARWVWPLIEYRSSRNIAQKHRVFIGAIILGLISKVIYDLIKLVF